MAKLDHLEIGTISFARCEGENIIGPVERVRLILAAAEECKPELLVTGGHAVHTLEHLRELAEEHAQAQTATPIITEVTHDRLTASSAETHAMYAVAPDGAIHAFGRQVNVFALVCGEINIVQGRHDPRYRSNAAKEAIMAADVVINPTHDRMGNAGTLDAKRRLLSRPSEDGRNRVYVSCSNWEACGNAKGRRQYVTPTLHTVYAAGKPVIGAEHADGSFGFAYRHWTLEL